MTLENIKKEIGQKALQTEKEIVSQAQQQVKDMQKNAAIEIHELEHESQQRFDSEMALLKTRELSMASMEAKKKLFDVKKSELAAAYAQAKEKIEAMPKHDREKFIAMLLKTAKSEIEVKTVHANKHDKALLHGVEVKESHISGGIICENLDGTMRIDYSFPTLFEQTKDKTLAGVSKKLFE